MGLSSSPVLCGHDLAVTVRPACAIRGFLRPEYFHSWWLRVLSRGVARGEGAGVLRSTDGQAQKGECCCPLPGTGQATPPSLQP
jgi:hypothetical protein